MAKITRKTAKIFGSTAGGSQIAKYGSFAAGVPVTYSGSTADPANIQALSNWLGGWFSGVEAGNSPAIEDMNAFCYVMAYQIFYSFEMGIAEWDSGTTYYIGSVVKASASSNYYISLTDANLNNAVTDPTNWIVMIDQLASQVTSVGANLIANARTRATSAYATAGNIMISPPSDIPFILTLGSTATVNVTAAPVNFATTDVNTSTETITIASHGMVTAQIINFSTTGGLPAPLAASTDYYAIVTGVNTFQVATTLANALSATPINITTQGSGTHHLLKVVGGTLVATGRPIKIDILNQQSSGTFGEISLIADGSFSVMAASLSIKNITNTTFPSGFGPDVEQTSNFGVNQSFTYPSSSLVGGQTLAAGTYSFKLIASNGNVHTTTWISNIALMIYEL